MALNGNISSQTTKSRIIIFNAIIILFFIIILYNLFLLQVVNTLEYKKRAEVVTRRSTIIFAQRGKIYDRNYIIPLVNNEEAFVIDIIPGEIENSKIDEVFIRISNILDIDVTDILDKIDEKYYSLNEPFEIANDVSKETIFYIAEHIQDFPGVVWRSEPKRNYLFTNTVGSLSHIIGYIGNISSDEFHELLNKGYTDDDSIGKSGIEKYYDLILRGEDGKRYRIADITGRKTSNIDDKIVPPVNGNDIILTIDSNIQLLSEKALGMRKGSVIVLKPSTGEILAMVSYPWYDPEVFTGNPEKLDELRTDPESPLLNRAIQSSYPPASVFKIVLITANVEDNVFPADRTVYCSGSFYYGNKHFYCWKRYGHGYLDLRLGFANSCNVYFWTIGLELGAERILRFANEYGLGRFTGIDLPQEREGFLPSPGWKENRYQMKWLGGDTLNLSIGQGWTLITPIQIANMVAMVVNKGTSYVPHFLKEVRDPETGRIISTTEREILSTSSISKDTFEFVQEAMRSVVTSGTCRNIISTPFEIAAKTGTGEVGVDGNYHSWFAAFGPYDANPEDQIVLVVMVEAVPGDWEWWGPKAGNTILHGIFTDQTFEEVVDDLNLWYMREYME
jgi:penicillin-binding protein 2